MIYKEIVEYIENLDKFREGGLENFKKFLEFIGNPQESLKTIHIAGTNGKGSTLDYLSRILIQGGYEVGSFISPSLEKINERISINKRNISDDEFEALANETIILVEKFKKLGGKDLLNYEFLTVMAFLYFKKMRCDFSLIEAGLGGRFDSTNIINPILSVVTSISMDHQDILGPSLEDIAWQKAGIIKPNTGLVYTYQEDQVEKVIQDECRIKNAPWKKLEKNSIKIKSTKDEKTIFDLNLKNKTYTDLTINSQASYQPYNSSLVVLACEYLQENKYIDIKEEDIYKGLEKATWPGRMEVLGKNPLLIIDGGHNEAALEEIFKSLENYDYNRLILGLVMMEDKDIGKSLQVIENNADIIICSQLDYSRSKSAQELAKNFKKNSPIIEYDLQKALERSIELANSDDLILFCGSLYMAGKIKSILKNKTLI